MQDDHIQNIVNPFIQLAHCFRAGDKIFGDKLLYPCSRLLAKYYVVYENKELLTHLLTMMNEAYLREDYVALADILEFDISKYLRTELSNLNVSELV